MKKKYLIFTLSSVITLGLVSIASCSSSSAQEDTKKSINFYVDDEVYFQIKTNGNEKLTLPSEPTKSDYKFDGWFLDKNYEEKFDISYYESHQLLDSIDVFAKFLKIDDATLIKPIINFYVDGNLYHQILTNGNEELKLPKNPEKEGYTFINWYLEESYENIFDITYYNNHELLDNVDVYAKFDLITFKVKFETYGGSLIEDFVGTIINESPITTKEGFEFDGWYLEKEFINKANFPLNLNNDITLYAKRNEIVQEIKPFEIDEKGKIIKVNSDNKIIKIPNNIDGIDVLTLGDYLFRDNVTVEEIELPSTLNYLGYSTFKNCTNLKKVTISSNINTIPSGSFENCVNLTEVNLPNTVKYINSNSFTNTGLTEFIAPSDIETIGESAFANCQNLSRIKLDGVRKIYRSAFEGCKVLNNVELPNSLENLENYHIFDNCENLEFIKMPTKIIPIYNSNFEGTKFYKNEKNWKDNGLYCDGYLVASRADYSTKSFKVIEGTKCIASDIVPDYVEEVTLPEGLEVISYRAFTSRSKLSKIKIPSTVKYIGQNAFYGTSIYNNSSNVYNDAIYLDGWMLGINNVENENTKHLKIKEGTIGICSGDIFNYSTRQNFETLTLNDGLKYICDNAFKNTNLVDVNFPSSLEMIGYGAFRGTKIKEVTLPKNCSYQLDSFNNDTIINQ